MDEAMIIFFDITPSFNKLTIFPFLFHKPQCGHVRRRTLEDEAARGMRPHRASLGALFNTGRVLADTPAQDNA